MMNNTIINIGDVLIVRVNTKISGRVTFSGYTDTIVGETEERALKREFRVSATNGLFWTEWKVLTDVALSENQFIAENSLLIEVRYTRIGTDSTDVIEFIDIQFLGTREEISFVAPTITSSIFENIIGSDCLNEIESNIFKKLYFRGILPNYITRAENNDENEDRDFIDLFFSVARFFGMFICFFKRFENFKDDFSLMREQVRQYGVYFDESNITLEELQYLSQHLYDELRQRGTNMIFKRKDDVLPSGKIVPIDGEFVRLLRNKISDELLYENIPLSKVGWCLRQSSPMYKGTSQSELLNKTKENTKDFQSLSNFVLNNEGTASHSLKSFDSKNVLNLKATNGKTGLGRIDLIQDVSENVYVADSRMDYEITFAFRIVSGVSSSVKLLFGVEGFDIMENRLNDAFITPNGDSISETFFEKELSNMRTDCWYYARGIIHAYSSSNLSESKTNLGYGTNLYFNNSFVKYILPKIQLISNGVSSEVNIWDYKIRPLVRGTNIIPLKDGTENSHSLGFIQSSRFLYTYVRNNNNNQSKVEITDIIEKYLYPFDSTNVFVFMSNY
ncbi:MAG: hypothetical protein PHS04_02850 [Tissierellia bacterium]|nr:hypothetical protein [Tissierellia bacterium]